MKVIDVPETAIAIDTLLHSLNEDRREGLMDTPVRVAKFYAEWLTGPKPEFEPTAFDAEGMDQMIVQRGIPFYSLCEHHMLPFFGDAIVAYVPNETIIGLSKLARIVDHHARKLQNQERITKDVASMLESALKPRGVAVVLKARHMCMEMRGIKARGAETVTSYITGVFRDDSKAREELLQLTKV